MTKPQGSNANTYARFVAISSGGSGLVLGAAAGSVAVLAQSLWPLLLLVGYLVFRLAVAARTLPHLVRLRRWWSMPLVALAAAMVASFAPSAAAPFVLGAAVAGFIAWTIVYAILDVRFDPRGEHGAGWL